MDRSSNYVKVRAGGVVLVFAVREPWGSWLRRPRPYPVYRVLRINRYVGGYEDVSFTPLLVDGTRLVGSGIRIFFLTSNGYVAAVDLIAPAVVKVLRREEFASFVTSGAVHCPLKNFRQPVVVSGLAGPKNEDRPGSLWLAGLDLREGNMAIFEVFHRHVSSRQCTETGVIVCLIGTPLGGRTYRI